MALLDEITVHVSDERDRTTKADAAQLQEVARKLAQCVWRVLDHRRVSTDLAGVTCLIVDVAFTRSGASDRHCIRLSAEGILRAVSKSYTPPPRVEDSWSGADLGRGGRLGKSGSLLNDPRRIHFDPSRIAYAFQALRLPRLFLKSALARASSYTREIASAPFMPLQILNASSISGGKTASTFNRRRHTPCSNA